MRDSPKDAPEPSHRIVPNPAARTTVETLLRSSNRWIDEIPIYARPCHYNERS